MKHPVKAPSVGESITEVSILKWNKPDGSAVKIGEQILEIESDKATVEIVAEQNGVLKILKPQGERVLIGAVIGEIDDAGKATAAAPTSASASATKAPAAQAPVAPAPAAAPSPVASSGGIGIDPVSASSNRGVLAQINGQAAARQSVSAPALSTSPARAATPAIPVTPDRPGDRRVALSQLRLKIAERLVQAQHTAAILTTFNEVDLSAVMAIRTQHKDAFKTKHGVALSFMSFFTRACVEALKQFPEVNASIDGREVVYHDYVDMGVAVSTERGLVVPVVKGADQMGFADIEKSIGALATKARDGKLSIADMSGGTFTISNGGVFGSLMSTPILNPPQSGILGMHKIQERPVAVDGKVVVRPMMYLALSYDHRLIDGRGAVSFLVAVKEKLEQPDALKFDY